MVIIINYGLGNLASVANMIRKVGQNAKITDNLNDIFSASKLILPGVGSYDHGIEQLHTFKLFSAIQEKAVSGTPLLGICLGMQLLASRSDEGQLKGLDLIKANFKKFKFDRQSTCRVPHVGWNHVDVKKENPLIPNDGSEQRFYFTHSYYAVCKNRTDVLATTEYGLSFTSAYCHKNVYGVQFHPEKSHRFGMALFKRFLEI